MTLSEAHWAHKLGYLAAERHRGLSACDYTPGTHLHRVWLDGYWTQKDNASHGDFDGWYIDRYATCA